LKNYLKRKKKQLGNVCQKKNFKKKKNKLTKMPHPEPPEETSKRRKIEALENTLLK
jgi:hypothetical protein